MCRCLFGQPFLIIVCLCNNYFTVLTSFDSEYLAIFFFTNKKPFSTFCHALSQVLPRLKLATIAKAISVLDVLRKDGMLRADMYQGEVGSHLNWFYAAMIFNY